MPDTFSAKIRSKIMSKIRSKDTSPELKVRSYLHRRGLRYRIHVKGLPGKPDMVFSKYKTVVFVHGCFWHQHPKPDCPHTGFPLSNKEYWQPKLERNVERDKKYRRLLEDAGWQVLVLWECEITEEYLEVIYGLIIGNLERKVRSDG